MAGLLSVHLESMHVNLLQRNMTADDDDDDDDDEHLTVAKSIFREIHVHQKPSSAIFREGIPFTL